MELKRTDGRAVSELRPVSIVSGVSPYAEGSAEVSFGKTKVYVSVSVEQETPRWMEKGQGGWITAEYGMLPRATHTRSMREASAGKQGGRTLECQRLIGRVLRQAIDLSLLDGLTFRVDCDVIVADGGTRTASITGAWVALYQAVSWACNKQLAPVAALDMKQVAAVSLGRVAGVAMLDLCYEEDSRADFDLNLAMNSDGALIEVQGTAERDPLGESDFLELLALGRSGITEIFAVQRSVVATINKNS